MCVVIGFDLLVGEGALQEANSKHDLIVIVVGGSGISSSHIQHIPTAAM